mmetsp:Transcript_14419/g.43686  ORF Transcript_14419/g.43686 Transcript_14419/m.43686 type:complete len:202 (-) Transcript_14419:335-940(-)
MPYATGSEPLGSFAPSTPRHCLARPEPWAISSFTDESLDKDAMTSTPRSISAADVACSHRDTADASKWPVSDEPAFSAFAARPKRATAVAAALLAALDVASRMSPSKAPLATSGSKKARPSSHAAAAASTSAPSVSATGSLVATSCTTAVALPSSSAKHRRSALAPRPLAAVVNATTNDARRRRCRKSRDDDPSSIMWSSS